MLELKTKTFKVSISVDTEARESFKSPLIFYLAHTEDRRTFFLTFVILDFSGQELIYIVSYNKENIALIEQRQDRDIFNIRQPAENPHCSIRIGAEAFLTFVEGARYFTLVDYAQGTMKVYTGEDIGLSQDEKLVDFGCTFYKDEDDPNFFYLTALTQSEKYPGRKSHFYRAKLDLSEIEEVYVMTNSVHTSPHVTRQFGRQLLNSNFLVCQIENNQTGQSFDNPRHYMRYVYEDLYQQYCRAKDIDFSPEMFSNTESIKKIMLNPGFNFFCQAKGKNFLEICQDEKYAFAAGQGTVMLLNLDTKKIRNFSTTYCSPAHFEKDDISGDIFVSSHNFLSFDHVYFIGPAAIDRFSLSAEGEMKKIATFTHPLIYRMTSHKVFSYAGKTYVCSFGQPSRLVFIDAEKMEMIHYEDVEEAAPTDSAEMLEFANDTSFELEPVALKTLEISPDGKFVFFLGYKYIYIYNFPERKIIQKIEYISDVSFGDDVNLSQFYKRTTHVDYLV
jgi:hypothetical protein